MAATADGNNFVVGGYTENIAAFNHGGMDDLVASSDDRAAVIIYFDTYTTSA